MAKRAELKGKKFGKLFVEEFSGINNRNSTLWKCKCDCGNTVIITAEKLNSGKKTSCGCDTRERRSKKMVKNLTGKRFGKLVVLEFDHSDGRSYWKCKCDCGNEIVVVSNLLKSGLRKSCGCLKRNDLTGKRFGRLVVKRLIGSNNERVSVWECECDCGKITKVRGSSLVSGKTTSCGCYAVEMHPVKHGMANTIIYNTWKGMIRRCYCENDSSYENYGGRGIKVCEKWQGEKGLYNFVKWSTENGYSEDLTIDRIDVNGNYEPSNCRWTNWETQNYNKRTTRRFWVCGELLTLKEISEGYGVPLEKLRRKYYGVYIEEISSTDLIKLRG